MLRCGFDKIDQDACKRRGIAVCNNPTYCTKEVALTAVGMIIDATRRISEYNHASKVYTSGWQENTFKDIERAEDLTVGVIGAGRIGTRVLKSCSDLGYKTAFFDLYRTIQDDITRISTEHKNVQGLSCQMEQSGRVLSHFVKITLDTILIIFLLAQKGTLV